MYLHAGLLSCFTDVQRFPKVKSLTRSNRSRIPSSFNPSTSRSRRISSGVISSCAQFVAMVRSSVMYADIDSAALWLRLLKRNRSYITCVRGSQYISNCDSTSAKHCSSWLFAHVKVSYTLLASSPIIVRNVATRIKPACLHKPVANSYRCHVLRHCFQLVAKLSFMTSGLGGGILAECIITPIAPVEPVLSGRLLDSAMIAENQNPRTLCCTTHNSIDSLTATAMTHQ